MTKVERRRTVVTLYHGNYEAELAALMEKAMAALRKEESGVTPKRANTRSKAVALALEYDALAEKAQETAVRVTTWVLRFDEWPALKAEHPPRDDDARDKAFGVNMATFPRALLEASLVTPGEAKDFEDLKAKGQQILLDLDVSMVNYQKLEAAAWNVNVEDDALPKESLVLLLKQASGSDSKPQPESE